MISNQPTPSKGSRASALPPPWRSPARQMPESGTAYDPLRCVKATAAILDELNFLLAEEETRSLLLKVRSSVVNEAMQSFLEALPHDTLPSSSVLGGVGLLRFFGSIDVLRRAPDPQALSRLILKAWSIRKPDLTNSVVAAADGPENFVVHPSFYVLDLNTFTKGLTRDEFRLLRRWYSPGVLPGQFAIRGDKPFEEFSTDLQRVASLLWRLGGLNPLPSDDLLRRFKGEVPVILRPAWIQIADGNRTEIAQYTQFRVPFGVYQSTRAWLLDTQRKVEEGKLTGAYVEVHGRIDPEFLAWAAGPDPHAMGPIPDVEIGWRITLPSQASYFITLKEKRGISLKPPNLDHNWTDEDRIIVRAVSRYFSIPANRRTWPLLHEISETVLPHRDPLSITSAAELVHFGNAWSDAVGRQVMETTESPRALYTKAPWLAERFRDEDYFLKQLAATVRALPTEQVHFDPDFVMLEEDEIPKFCATYGRRMFQICESERERLGREARDGTHRARAALGHPGPVEGFPLSLTYMALDAIVDKRRYERYRREVAKERGIAPEEVKVPLKLGRRYDKPEWFIGCADVPRELAKLKPRRVTRVMLIDPLSEKGDIPFTGDPAALPEYLDEINIKRVQDIFPQLGRRGDLSKTQRAVVRAVGLALDAKLSELEGLAHSLTEAKTQRAEELKELEHTLKRQKVDRGDYRRLMYEEREYQDGIVREALERLRRERQNYLQIFSQTYPAAAKSAFVTIREILDQEAALFIFSIGADNTPILHLDHLDFRRTHSEQLGGKNMYAGGELKFVRHEEIFHNFKDWEHFHVALAAEPEPRPWVLREANNASGHYEPDAATLPFAANIIFPLLEEAHISTKDCELRDGVAPLLRLRGVAYFDHGRRL